MVQDFSPEERLLRLIRGEKKQKEKPTAEKSESPQSPTELPTTGVRTIKYEPRSTRALTGEWRYLKFINSALIIIFIITVGFFIFDLVSSKFQRPIPVPSHEPKVTNQGLTPQPAETQRVSHETQTPPFSTYAEAMGKRELFKPLELEIQPEKGTTVEPELVYDKIKDLSLIGIIAGEKPQVVIEDKKIQKTYFLYEGQMLNQMKVEKISEDRVILDFNGEKIELAL